jgi:hypothetical protein
MSRLTKRVREWRARARDWHAQVLREWEPRILAWRRNHFPLPLLAELLRSDGILNPRLSHQSGHFSEVTFEKAKGRLHIRIGWRGNRQTVWWVASNRLPVFARIVQITSAEYLRVRANLEDARDEPGVMTPSSSKSGAILIPDPDFYITGGYAHLRAYATAAPAWLERSDVILWRGSSTGQTVRMPRRGDDLSDPATLPRVRMCALLRGMPKVDARIADVVQTKDPAGLTAILQSAGLIAERIPQERWIEHKFAIDIDGNANAWSGLFRSLLFGCCVIKIASPRNYRQWYYDRLLPFEHYVPVRADMSDLRQQIEWCRDNLKLCAQIAANGQRLANSMDFQEELAAAARRVERAASTLKRSAI